SPAFMTVIEVLIANGIKVIAQQDDGFTPTPAISHAILDYNRQHEEKTDGIVITPSHNPPEDGGIKYNPPHGGPANEALTVKIEDLANQFISDKLSAIRRINYQIAIKNSLYQQQDLIEPYVVTLGDVIDMAAIKKA
ncbi:MAG: phosphoglucomutase, alpha-D-glucose phosphate-specific, partial [Arsenophonus sp. NC-QC1-MAG3]